VGRGRNMVGQENADLHVRRPRREK
jgi:hypothetical protein